MPIVMIDRDGTLIEERQYLSAPDQVALIGRAADALRMLRDSGLQVVVVTNQSAIGRGFFGLETLNEIHQRMHELLGAERAAIDALYFCPHVPDDGCQCRKPAPGLAERAAREFGANLSESFVVGDKECDIDMGRGVGATTILVRTGYGAALVDRGYADSDYIADDLYGAACVIRDLIKTAKATA